MLYHGSVEENIQAVWARSKSHTSNRSVAYFTSDRVYALVCCRKRTENFVTMGPDRNGIQHYFERFPRQLQTLYEGREVYLYTPLSEEGLTCTRGHTWESSMDVPVRLYEHVLDLYREIIQEERAGNVVVHRYEETDPEELQKIANYIRDHLNDPIYTEYRDFLYKHFSLLWE